MLCYGDTPIIPYYSLKFNIIFTPLLTVPIQANTPALILKSIPQEKQVGALEIWIDKFKKSFLNTEEISKLVSSIKKLSNKKLLIVCKSPAEQGSFQGSDHDKVQLLLAAAESGADFIDIGLHSNKKEIKLLKSSKKRAKLIISHHNFAKTPSKKSLYSKVSQINQLGADIIKIATMCHTVSDTERLMELALDLKEKQGKHIILGMGKAGVITRLFAKHIGNELNFVSASTKTALGQFDLKTMLSFEKVLN